MRPRYVRELETVRSLAQLARRQQRVEHYAALEKVPFDEEIIV